MEKLIHEETVAHQDRLLKDLLLGFVKLHILHHANISPIFGQEFRNELKRHGYEMSFGTLYPMFHSLVEHGYLKMDKKNVEGKIRKYYAITAKGKNLLAMGKAKAKELTDELFES